MHIVRTSGLPFVGKPYKVVDGIPDAGARLAIDNGKGNEMNERIDVLAVLRRHLALAKEVASDAQVTEAREVLDSVAELIDRHAELEVAAARLAVERAEFRRDREALVEALLLALPYATDAEGFPEQFKPGVVKKHVEQIRAALARVQGGAK